VSNRQIEPGIVEHGPFQNAPEARGGYFEFAGRELHWYEQLKGGQFGLTRAEALTVARECCRKSRTN
jgi:hypothetical protein